MSYDDISQARAAAAFHGQLYQYEKRATVDDAIVTIRARAATLRSNLASVEAWTKELARIDAMLAAWGDK